MPPLRSALLVPASLFLLLAVAGLIMVIDRCSLASASVLEPLEVAEPSPTAAQATPTLQPTDTVTPTVEPPTPTPTPTSPPTPTLTPTPEPPTPTEEPPTVTPEPETVTPEPGTVTVEPGTVTVEPGTVTVEPGTVTPEPETVTPEPETPTVAPDTPTVPPDTPTSTTEPASPTSEPPLTETVSPTDTGTPEPGTPGPTAVPESYFGRAEYPGEMEIGRSDVLTVSLINTQGAPVDITEGGGNAQVVGTIAVAGTPGALETARGAGYTARATANLDAVAFDVQPATQPLRGLPANRLDWQWTLRSSEAGQQVLIVSIDVEWTPSGGGPGITERLWSQAIEIEVTKPFISFGSLQLATLVSGFLGSGLSVPFIYGLIREHREKTRTDEEEPNPGAEGE